MQKDDKAETAFYGGLWVKMSYKDVTEMVKVTEEGIVYEKILLPQDNSKPGQQVKTVPLTRGKRKTV